MATYSIRKDLMNGELRSYGSPRLWRVDETKWELTWNKMVEQWHYLASSAMVGSLVKYFIILDEWIVGAISFCTAAYKLGPRDKHIGWSSTVCQEYLPRMVENNRFLILPCVKIKNLASAILAESVRRLKIDWPDKYGVCPVLIETYVDTSRFTGVCYRAANWVYLGQTQGYSRGTGGFTYHGNKKAIYIHIIDKRFKKEFKPGTVRLNNAIKELEEMINGIPQWYPSLTEKIGLNKMTDEDVRRYLAEHLSTYTPYLGRKEHHRHLVAMTQGLLSDLERKSIEPIALAFEGIDHVRVLTKFMSDAKWHEDEMQKAYQTELAAMLSAEGGMITGDDTCFPKKGHNTVGVARQYCGNTGKIDNCQAAPMVGYVSGKGYGIFDWRLYMPKAWFEDDHRDLRVKCKVPEQLSFETKNKMLLDMILSAHKSGKLKARYVGVDASYGSDSAFLDALPEQLIYFADVRKDQRVFASRPETSVPDYKGKGRRPHIPVAAAQPVTVEEIAANESTPFNDVALGIGAKGPIFSKDKVIRVVEVRDDLPGKDIWLYVRQLEDGSLKYSLTNAPLSSTLEEIRKPALLRWSIEQCFKELKDYLGMDNYETRNWAAFHRYMLLSNMSHLFINKLRNRFSAKMHTPGATPYIDHPVPADEFLDAAIQLGKNEPITNTKIKAVPDRPQQVLTIGLVQKFVNAAFVKIGRLREEIDYQLMTAAASFDSHSRAKLNQALAKRESVAT
jgi:SRSO17 transposase